MPASWSGANIGRGGSAHGSSIPFTKMGAQLGLPFFAMTAWGDKWLGEGEPHFGLRSRANGQKLRVALVDGRGKSVKPRDVQYIVDNKVWPPEESGKP